MPCSAAATMPAIARYGLTSPPGVRFSTRTDSAECPTIRSAQVRLSRPHRTAVGANEPGWYRLYELMFGAYSRLKSRIVASRPASTDSPSVRQVRRPVAGHRRGRRRESRSEKWMWQELPSRWFGLAMKVSAMPSCAAISLAPFL